MERKPPANSPSVSLIFSNCMKAASTLNKKVPELINTSIKVLKLKDTVLMITGVLWI
jgi:hypothetical protein